MFTKLEQNKVYEVTNKVLFESVTSAVNYFKDMGRCIKRKSIIEFCNSIEFNVSYSTKCDIGTLIFINGNYKEMKKYLEDGEKFVSIRNKFYVVEDEGYIQFRLTKTSELFSEETILKINSEIKETIIEYRKIGKPVKEVTSGKIFRTAEDAMIYYNFTDKKIISDSCNKKTRNSDVQLLDGKKFDWEKVNPDTKYQIIERDKYSPKKRHFGNLMPVKEIHSGMVFKSMKDASKILDIPYKFVIIDVQINSNQKKLTNSWRDKLKVKLKGYSFEPTDYYYEKEDSHLFSIKLKNLKTGEKYNSIKEAAISTGINWLYISNCCKLNRLNKIKPKYLINKLEDNDFIYYDGE